MIAQCVVLWRNMNFWEQLPKPFFIQAPMEDVTDAAFRRLIARFGRPHVMYTEFTSADGLVRAPEEGKRILLKKLEYAPEERPIVAQLFTANPDHMAQAAKLCADLGFDGIDINMGCPDRAVEKSGCGAALIKNPPLARELIRAAKTCGLPVSVKTRLGYNVDELETWLPELLAENPVAVTIHCRTRKEMSDVPARWDRIKRAVEIRDALRSKALIAGNGDVKNLSEARARTAETGCDGVMLGRAIFGNPWLYADRAEAPTPQERITALVEHIQLFDELLGDTSNFATMKKHFKAYISGWDHAKDLRVALMETSTATEAIAVLEAAKV
jgi:nifR3 family TIM-barrel protein